MNLKVVGLVNQLANSGAAKLYVLGMGLMLARLLNMDDSSAYADIVMVSGWLLAGFGLDCWNKQGRVLFR